MTQLLWEISGREYKIKPTESVEHFAGVIFEAIIDFGKNDKFLG